MLKFLNFVPKGRIKRKELPLHFCNAVGSIVSRFDLNQVRNGSVTSGEVDEARRLFDKISDRDGFAWNTMIASYANSGRLSEAKKLFNETPVKNFISWSSLISGYSKYGRDTEAFELFWQMQFEGYMPSQYTLDNVLRVCSMNGLLQRGQEFHGYATKTCFDMNAFVLTSLVDMYAKCKCIFEAECLFLMMPDRKNHVAWTTMITGYSQNGCGYKAIACFQEMRIEGVGPNQYTFPSILTACAAISARDFGAQLHGCIFRSGFEANVFVQSALVDMYAKCRDMDNAKRLLEENMEIDNEVSWNSMIVGFVRQELYEEALSLFRKMHARDIKIDDFALPSILNCFASNMDLYNAKSTHSLIVKTGFEGYKLVNNALIDMYAKQGNLESALSVFNHMQEKDVISWTSLVTGYAHHGAYEEALNYFCDMRIAGTCPDHVAVSSILSACAELTVLEFGRQVHSAFLKSGVHSSLSVDNSLVMMYAKCGCIEDANRVFDSMQTRDVITWTALIIGYAQNGKGKESLQFYDRMLASGTKPDYITFIGILFACSHAGLVENARCYFESMDKVYGIKPGPDHYACMIDLLGRCGKLDEAKELLDRMVEVPDATVWKALLSACRVHGNLQLGERAANNLFELEPMNAMPYVLLSNMYSTAGKWEDASRVRRLMKSMGIRKEPGCSWVEMSSQVHIFISEDRGHPMRNEIYSKIDEMMILIREAGYVPDMSFALHDVDEEGKELGLAYHSEKLAVAFGLLASPQGAPIRIFKNLRVCGDCHTAMKYISAVYSRHVILRDSNRFHHFKQGNCSCGDYW